MKNNLLGVASTLAIALSSSVVASAQTQDESAYKLDELIVTATRRSVSAEDIPYNISVTTGESLARAGVTDFSKLSRMIPGLAYIDQGPRDAGINSNLIIRGLNAGAAIGSDVISLAAPTVSTYVDETPIFVNLQLYDIERVEVLRGPQGTLYGSGSLGGTIRYLHKKPDTSEFTARLDSKLSSTKGAGGISHDISGVVNVPIADNFAVRIAGGYTKNQGFIDANRAIVLDDALTPTFVDPTNPFTSSLQEAVVKDHDDADLWHLRVSGLLEVSDALTVNLAWQHQKDNFDGAQVVNPDHPDGGNFANTNSVLETLDRTVDIFSLDLDIDLGFASLSSSTSYYKNKYDLLSDQNGIYLNSSFWYRYAGGGNLYYDGFGAENVIGVYSGVTKGITQEIRLTSQGDGPVQWLVGGFYLDQSQDVDQIDVNTGYWGLIGYPTVFGITPADAIAAVGREDAIFRQKINSDYRDIAVFGEVVYNVTDRLSITGGARFFDQKFENKTDIYLNLCSSFCSNDGINPFGLTGGSEVADFNDQIFKLNTSYNLNDNIMTFATWSQGFRHGGSNGIPTTESSPGAPFSESPDLANYDSDKATNWELGIKGRTDDGRVRFSVAAFHIVWNDIQLNVASPLGAFPIVVNGDKAFSTGLEAEVTAAVSEKLHSYPWLCTCKCQIGRKFQYRWHYWN